jgi:hypothetical protein
MGMHNSTHMHDETRLRQGNLDVDTVHAQSMFYCEYRKQRSHLLRSLTLGMQFRCGSCLANDNNIQRKLKQIMPHQSAQDLSRAKYHLEAYCHDKTRPQIRLAQAHFSIWQTYHGMSFFVASSMTSTNVTIMQGGSVRHVGLTRMSAAIIVMASSQ